MRIPQEIALMRIAEPPAEKKGRARPVVGITPVTTARFKSTCKDRRVMIPKPASLEK